jgi:hypothetical protein
MNVFVPPSAVDQNGWSSEDELDGLLRAYYKAELPNSWPSPQAPTARNDILPMRPSTRRFPMLRSRLALAACVAFLVAGPLALSAYFGGGGSQVSEAPQTVGADSTTASNPNHDLPYNIKVEKNGSSIEIRIPYGREK